MCVITVSFVEMVLFFTFVSRIGTCKSRWMKDQPGGLTFGFLGLTNIYIYIYVYIYIYIYTLGYIYTWIYIYIYIHMDIYIVYIYIYIYIDIIYIYNIYIYIYIYNMNVIVRTPVVTTLAAAYSPSLQKIYFVYED